AAYMQDEGKLRGSAVVTVMSNLGLLEFLRGRGINTRITAVGDRYVLEDMLASDSNIGGEQSGHVIMTDYCTTGDGQMTAVQILSMIKTKGIKASDISRIISSFPQIMINVEVRNDLKKTIGASDEVKAIEEEIRDLFGDSGRILIRPSGTEAKVRVMVEGKDKELVTAMAHKAADVIRGLAQKA
ncbi:MAG: phosphoglucosamine mutase, partial [Clostridia bacterium]|nr:phosphoglucosamine mutase [Clostridia bacterium]